MQVVWRPAMGICKGLHRPLLLTPIEGPSRCLRLGTRASLQGPSLCRRPSSRALPHLCRQRCVHTRTPAHVADASGTLSFALHHCEGRAVITTPPPQMAFAGIERRADMKCLCMATSAKHALVVWHSMLKIRGICHAGSP